MTVPAGLLDDSGEGCLPRHAELLELKALGFRILPSEPAARIVQLDGRTFMEGALKQMLRTYDDNICEARGQGRPNGTLSEVDKADEQAGGTGGRRCGQDRPRTP